MAEKRSKTEQRLRYEALITRLEQTARQNLAGYKMRVGLLAALGYAYVVFFLLLSVGLVAGVGWLAVSTDHLGYGAVKVMIALGCVAFVLLKSMWVTIPPPEGIALKRQDAPRLFDMVDGLRISLQAPRFDRILLDGEFNAAAAQRPRLGIFGWQQNYLVFGMPLMCALPPDQFKAVVAHELGHISGNHARFGGWIYRVLQTWENLLNQLEANNSRIDFLFVPFFRWYVPLFSAYSFVLRRMNEYEADAAASQVSGVAAAGNSLINVRLRGMYLASEYWPELAKQVQERDSPPESPFTSMRTSLTRTLPDKASSWLRTALIEETGHADTHPSLVDRLEALGYPLAPLLSPEDRAYVLPVPSEQTAADFYLGESARRFLAELDSEWKAKVAEGWAERHKEARESLVKLEELDRKYGEMELSEEERWQRAQLTAEFRTPGEAIQQLREMLAEKPDDAKTAFFLGMMLIDEKDEAGIPLIEQAVAVKPEFSSPGCQAVFGYLMELGRKEEAQKYRQRALLGEDLLEEANEERSTITAKDTFAPHDLPMEAMESLVTALQRFGAVHKAYLARKVVKTFSNRPLFVLGLELDAKWKAPADTDAGALWKQFMDGFDLPGDVSVVLIGQNNAAIGRALKAAPGSAVFGRSMARR